MIKSHSRYLLQAYRQAPWRVQLQAIGGFSLILVILAIVASVYLNITARSSTIGRQIQEMQIDRLELERQIQDLESQLAELSSAKAMASRAEELGFVRVQPGQITYLAIPGYSGRNTVSLAPPPGPAVSTDPALPAEYTQNLLDWIRKLTVQATRPAVGPPSIQSVNPSPEFAP